MGKVKTTRKSITESFAKIVSIGYCDAQHLLCFHSPIAYTCGVYGWNFDVYDINGTAVCTGYRGMPGKHLSNVGEYERQAEQVLKSNATYEVKRLRIDALLEQLLKGV